MKICPLCQKQYPDTDDVCNIDGARLLKRKVTLPWEMEAISSEESEEGLPPGVTKSDTFIDPHPDDTVDLLKAAAKHKNTGPTVYELTGDDQTADAAEASSEIDLGDDTLAEEFPAIHPGTLLGYYKLEEKLGEGGMGEVFLAEHTKLGRKVAIKVLRSEYSHNQNAVDRFFNEARAVNQIAHRHIVQITDFFEQPGGQNYYVMEYLKGRSLQDMLFNDGALSADDLVHIAMQIASALDAVHKQSIIHRDLKPENIFILNSDELDNYVKLLDFGVAKLLEPVHGTPLHKTQTGVIMGTPEYMAPEQLKREPVTPRTDIYAFGLILFEMATGCRPWKYDNMGELVVAHMTKVPPKINQVSTVTTPFPPNLEKLVCECLEKDPKNRPGNMKEVEERLGAALENPTDSFKRSPEMMVSGGHRLNPVPTRPPETMITGGLDASAIEQAVRNNQNRTALWIAMIFLLLVTGVAGIASQWEALFPEKQSINMENVEQFPPLHLQIKEVSLNLKSNPSGALVYDEKEDAPLGKTPLSLSLMPSAERRIFIFSKDGYHKLKKEITVSQSSELSVELLKKPIKTRPLKARPPPPSKKVKNTRQWIKPQAPKKAKDKSGLIDPFSM